MLKFNKVGKKVIPLALMMSVVSAMPVSATSFSDVQPTDWHYGFVSDMASRGFVSGVSSESYDPNASLSIAAFATMLTNGFYGSSFSLEGIEGEWWMPYMNACANRDAFQGTRASDSALWDDVANDTITRYEMAQMISNLLKDRGMDILNASQQDEALSGIADIIYPDYQDAVAIVYHYGFLTGRSNGNFDGEATLSRAEAAVVLSSLVNSPLVSIERA